MNRPWNPTKEEDSIGPEIQLDFPPAEEHPVEEHPLETTWTFWLYPRVIGGHKVAKSLPACRQQPTTLNYERDLQPFIHFATVESFFRGWKSLERPSMMVSDMNIAIFRSSTKPMWEIHPNGGRFVMRIRRSQVSNGARSKRSPDTLPPSPDNLSFFIDSFWEEIALRLVGEDFELPEVVGAVCGVRTREFVVALWVTNGDHPGLRKDVTNRLSSIFQAHVKKCSRGPQHAQIQFDAFRSRLRDQNRLYNPPRQAHTSINHEATVVHANGAKITSDQLVAA